MAHTLVENINEAVALYEGGATAVSIAQRYGASTMTVLKHLRAAGVEIRKPGMTLTGSPKKQLTPEQEVEVVRRYADGGTVQGIAVEIGVSPGTISNALRRRGCKTRPAHARKRVSDEIVRTLHAHYQEGARLDELAAGAGYTTGGLHAAFTRLGLPMRERGKVPLTAADPRVAGAVALWDTGLGVKTVEKRTGVAQKVILRCLRESGRDPDDRRSGPGHHSWKGGRQVTDEGYVRVWVADDDPLATMRNARGYVLEHRLIMARQLGRPLTGEESVHHVDGDRERNVIENLQLRIGQHGSGRAQMCAQCGCRDIVDAPLG